MPRDVVHRAAELLGKRITADTGVAECWREAAGEALGTDKLTKENYEEKYKSAQGRFWRLVAKNPAAKAFFTEKGFVVDGTRVAYLPIKGVDIQETSLGLDHTLPKASGQNFRFALGGDKLQFLLQADNTNLSHIEKKGRSRGDNDGARRC